MITLLASLIRGQVSLNSYRRIKISIICTTTKLTAKIESLYTTLVTAILNTYLCSYFKSFKLYFSCLFKLLSHHGYFTAHNPRYCNDTYKQTIWSDGLTQANMKKGYYSHLLNLNCWSNTCILLFTLHPLSWSSPWFYVLPTRFVITGYREVRSMPCFTYQYSNLVPRLLGLNSQKILGKKENRTKKFVLLASQSG